jgi:inner membrane protein
MKLQTHLIFGLCIFFIYLLLQKFNFIQDQTLFFHVLVLCILLVGCALPDIDYHKSTIGKYFFFLNYGATHRGFLHGLFGVTLCTLIFFMCLLYAISLTKPYAGILSMFFCVGLLSHLLLDALNPKGILLCYPLGPKLLGPIEIGSLFESLLQIVLLCFVTLLGLILVVF